ncbi:MAG TPA: lysylphosphatidylglycerol synthase domain-containing protein [Gemmatimonadaceae bacterium]|nr:lysylphosphatidylglycerol synthase domain-containing protein [Gemmatimonadaceae bacterium]
MQRKLLLATQWIFAVAIVWFAISALKGQWRHAGARLSSLTPDWPMIGASAIIVVLTYVLLIDAWRRVVTASGQTLGFATAARIWFVSNLGKYVPGKVWSIAAMTMMARDNAVSGVVAAGSSLLMQLVSILTGIGVVLITGAQALDHPRLAILAAVALGLALLATPQILPPLIRYAARVSGREVTVPRLETSTVLMAALRSAISWVAYGVAFQLFVRGLLGSAAGATTSYIAVYAASYIIGFLALFAPGGAVVRESAMVTGILRLGIAGQADAIAIALASRLWLTVLELLPGLGYLAAGRRRPHPTN